MRWIKWTMLAAASAGCLPALAFADEPAKPNASKRADASPKIELRIEFQKDGDKPHVIVLGKDGANNTEELTKLLIEMTKEIASSAQKGAQNRPNVIWSENKAQPKAHEHQSPDVVTFERLTDQIAERVLRVAPTARAHKKGTYLGVATSDPPEVVRKQLGLHDGMGLVVDSVMPDSPAAKAGLAEYDVLQKVDDQLIVNYAQFTVLIRDHKPGDEVKLSVIHEGKPAVVTAKLIEHPIEVGSADYEFNLTLPVDIAQLARRQMHRANLNAPQEGPGGKKLLIRTFTETPAAEQPNVAPRKKPGEDQKDK